MRNPYSQAVQGTTKQKKKSCDPGDFSVEAKTKMYFVPEPGQEPTFGAAASTIPQSSWDTASHLKVIWNVKWSCNGLMCVRPVIATVADAVVPAGRTFICRDAGVA